MRTLYRSFSSRCVAQIEAEFGIDRDDDYRKFAQLKDPRISYRVGQLYKSDILLLLAKTYLSDIPETMTIEVEIDADDILAAASVGPSTNNDTNACSQEVI